jgi:hypothetical protein
MRPKFIVPVVLVAVSAVCAFPAAAGSVAVCNPNLLSRQGNEITLRLSALAQHFNQRLQAAHSKFNNLRLTPKGPNTLEIAGEKNGQPVSISGPLAPNSYGGLQLHATQITRNGNSVKGMMDLFGKDLASSVNLHNLPSLYAKGNNLEINVDRLLGVAGHVTGVRLHGSQIRMEFSSQPCR